MADASFFDCYGPEAQRRRGRARAKALAERSRGRWVMFDPIGGFDMPSAPAVYAVYFGPELVYIGQTSDLRARFSQHKFSRGPGGDTHTPWGALDTAIQVKVKAKISRRYGDWAMIELRLLRKLRPRLNSQFSIGRARGRAA